MSFERTPRTFEIVIVSVITIIIGSSSSRIIIIIIITIMINSRRFKEFAYLFM